MAFTLCSSYAILTKAGYNVSSTAATSGSIVAQLSDEAEALVCTYARYNFIGNAGNIKSYASGAVAEATANLAAMGLIAYDMSSFPSRGEAEDRINVLNYKAFKILDMLKEDKNRTFLISGYTGAV